MGRCEAPPCPIRPPLHYSITPFPSAPRLQLHDIMRRSLALAGGADANETGLLTQLSKVSRAQVAHAGLDAADQLRQDVVHRAASFLQRLDSFRGDLAGRVRRVAVTRGRPFFHRRKTAHAAVLLVEFAP